MLEFKWRMISLGHLFWGVVDDNKSCLATYYTRKRMKTEEKVCKLWDTQLNYGMQKECKRMQKSLTQTTPHTGDPAGVIETAKRMQKDHC